MSEADADDTTAAPDRLVKLARYASPELAEIHATALAAEGIHAEVFGARTATVNWFWQNFNDVELQVPARDAERAAAIIARTETGDLEPAEEPASAPPPVDDRGRPLVPLAAFDSVAGMRSAEAVLASARIDAFSPRLVPRGDQPAGHGKRFILRVANTDLDRANAVLQEESRDDEGELRCPNCGSWNVYQPGKFWAGFIAAVGLGPKPHAPVECLACHHRGTTAEFTVGADESTASDIPPALGL